MKQFLIKNYSLPDGDKPYSISLITEQELFELIQLREEVPPPARAKIAVYEIGDCVLDFS